ncbi:MAG TPA: trypsin-like peptidase domain-containing protein [Solirubrobacteraceae bacterium]|jgi:putative serine protease PepD|nr:trypsin-like peptidase domain-containing protein [Solirubrobacteraceae bacterium]
MNLKILVPAVMGAIAGAIVAVIVGGGSTTRSVTTTVMSTGSSSSSIPTSLSKTQGMSVNQIYRKDSPGVVDITVTSQQSSGGGLFGGGGGTQQTEGEGAGVVYDKKGDILTDQHVVSGATSVTVHLQNGVNAKATVLGQDASTDMAVIRVKVPASVLHPISFANSNDVQVGDAVVAIGSPFSLPETVTSGIVSSVGRSIPAPNGYTISGAIQTDAPINPGNSGGPLLDGNGAVLGLNDQIDTNSDQSAGVGFATPGNADVQVADTIISGHKVQHSYVGVCLNSNSVGGAQISTSANSTCPTPVVAGSPAARAGLKPGDTITSINGTQISSTNQFIAVVGKLAPGKTVTMTVKSGDSSRHVKVTLGARPASAPTG